MKRKNILVLGATGMVGSTVFSYLHANSPTTVWGTSNHSESISKNIFHLTAESYKKDFLALQKELTNIDYVINCIGVVNNSDKINKLIYVNALLPHLLEELAEEHSFKLIHISTDAVFAPLSQVVKESSPISPTDNYGMSKSLGETISHNALSFRTSLIGFDPITHKGLLEKILVTQGTIEGFDNQIWSGCTTLQFAKLCESIISNNLFEKLREESNVYHFSPIKPVSKYILIKNFMKITKNNSLLNKRKGKEHTRILQTLYFDLLQIDDYTRDIYGALAELITYQNTKI